MRGDVHIQTCAQSECNKETCWAAGLLIQHVPDVDFGFVPYPSSLESSRGQAPTNFD